MRQSFQVTVPASNLSLIPIERLRAAADLEPGDDTRDDELLALGAAVSTDIAVACHVADDGVNPPTLLRETVTETLWMADRPEEIFLSRRFISAISAVTESGSTLIQADFTLNAGAGMLYRVSGGRPYAWLNGQASVTYVAGFTAAPPDLLEAAIDLARIRLSGSSRDPLVKSESIEVPDIETRRQDFWVGALPGTAASPVPPDIMARLSRYANLALY
jgi:hypothetical protein